MFTPSLSVCPSIMCSPLRRSSTVRASDYVGVRTCDSGGSSGVVMSSDVVVSPGVGAEV
jgi:hypothetical protein